MTKRLTSLIAVALLTGCGTMPLLYPNLKINALALKNTNEATKRALLKIDEEVSTHVYLENFKSFAYAIGDNGGYALGWSSEKKTQAIANKIAMKYCNDSRKKNYIEEQCRVYMEGDKVIKPILSPVW